MRNNTVLATALASVMITGCADPNPIEGGGVDIRVDNTSPSIQKKETESSTSLIGVAPIYEKPATQIDYSQLLDNETELPIPTVKTSDIYSQNTGTQPWESQIRNKPLSHIKSNYKFNKNTKNSILVDLLAYTPYELEVIDSAFPQLVGVEVASIYDGNTILLSHTKIDGSDDLDVLNFNKKGQITAKLMNIDCPELEQPGGLTAKTKLSDFLALKDNAVGKNKPSLKIRYRTNGQEVPLVLLTLDFNGYEVSMNRSLVYSGACFTYAQFNQDQLMPSISNEALKRNKGIWSQKNELIAENNWLMPWEFRAKNP